MVAIIRDKLTGEVAAVMEDSNISTTQTDDPDDDGGGFSAVSEQDQEVIHRNETEEQFWEHARRSAGGEARRIYVYDSGAVDATTEAPEMPPGPVEKALLEIRAAVDERAERDSEGESAPSHKALLVEDVDRALQRERERVGEDER